MPCRWNLVDLGRRLVAIRLWGMRFHVPAPSGVGSGMPAVDDDVNLGDEALGTRWANGI